MTLGLIETARVENGRVPLWPLHLDRLCRSAADLGLPLPAALPGAVDVAAAASRVPGPVAAVRLHVVAGVATLEARPVPAVGGWHACLATGPRQGRAEWRGYKTDRRADCEAAARQAHQRGCDEALWCDAAGLLTEGTVSNVFVRLGDRLRTPPASAGLLAGIARGRLLAAGRLGGVRLQVAPLAPAELATADEVFVTNAVRGAVPLLSLDGRALSRGDLWRLARSAVLRPVAGGPRGGG